MGKIDPVREMEIESQLRAHNLSITTPRKLVLNLLQKEHGPFTAEEIYQRLPKGSCDLASVYRSLTLFVEKELVDIAHLSKDVVHYEFHDPGHHHHHIICRICQKIDTFHDCAIDKIERTLEKLGYTKIKHRFEVDGVCLTCSKNL